MSNDTFHFEVEGSRRDYDFSTFCENHQSEAMDFANEWLLELVDGTDVGDTVDIKVHVRKGAAERCYACEPARASE